jgi:organic radical activating enzyme
MRELRKAMLEDKKSTACRDCYERESNGFHSLRNGCNKTYGHHVKKVKLTTPDGSFPKTNLIYWDVRFSNICNLKCRMCSSNYSSRWYDDDIKIWGKELRPRVNIAGRTPDDLWQQMQEHIPHIEHIYFAGGEPLIMEEHYQILQQLIDMQNTKVHLTYATNLTELTFKNQSVLDLWKAFPKIGVNASLDDMGDRASVIRSGTNWAQVEQNIRDLKRECPHIDLTIGPTISIMNIWNICKFHRYLVDQQLIQPKDFNINIIQNPAEYRIDILPADIKQKLKQEIEQHLEWLRPMDPSQRATVQFESIINFMTSTDNSALLPKFWKTVDTLDRIRSESLLDVVPELKLIEQYRR